MAVNHPSGPIIQRTFHNPQLVLQNNFPVGEEFSAFTSTLSKMMTFLF